MKNAEFVSLIFDHGFNERDEFEAESRGYRSHVWVELSDGAHYPVNFFDITRLSQSLEDGSESGREFFSEPGLIVVSSVTRANMEAAARALAAEGFFVNSGPVQRTRAR